ncbi:hypothetical protein GXW82_03565 [Streptacidiphilus sp. 4-A2]|nr:hypothetical protein [Streptacidiphilus sp. 4-A2]
MDAEHLERSLRGNDVTAIYLTKALFDLLVAESPQTLTLVREVWTSGEEALSLR